MNKSTDLRRGRNCVFLLHVHLVFVTKYRKKVFKETMIQHMKGTFHDVCQDFESSLIEFDGEEDHVHLLIEYPPKIPVSKLVNSLKGVSSRYLRRDFPEISKYCLKNQLWSPSYFAASCGGAPLRVNKEYIENQKTPSS